MATSSSYRWLIFALLGALFAAAVSVLNKRALGKVDLVAALMVQACLALATVSVLYFWISRPAGGQPAPRSVWILLALSGVATGLSWFFGYRALQITDVAKSTPIDKLSLPIAVIFAMVFLAERPGMLSWAGIALMLLGSILVARG